MPLFFELTLILVVTAIVSCVMKLLRQPLIVGYLLVGILIGPQVFNLLHATEEIEIFSKIGITILLFIVGLSLSPHVIKEVGKASLVTGIGQIIFTSIIGFLIAIALGLSHIAALYVGIALTFSSTIIILKLFSDKGDLEKLHAKIAVGFLLVQDIIATLILVILGTSQSEAGMSVESTIGITILKAVIIFTAILLFQKFILSRAAKFLASSSELLFVCSLAWGLGLATLFQMLGFSIEIGALIAGVVLASTPYSYEIGSRLRPLRDFFILIFFVLLGSQMVVQDLSATLVPAVILSVFVLIGNPVIVILLMNLLGYSKRTSFLSGLATAQISEFSLILATLGLRLGHIDQQTLSLITFVGILTITGSTYFIMFGEKVYTKFARVLGLLMLRKRARTAKGAFHEKPEMVLFGYHRVGEDFVRTFQTFNRPFAVVDFDPNSIELLKQRKLPYIYGDAEDAEFLNEFDFKQVKLVVSTIPDSDTNMFLVSHIRNLNKHAIVLVISNNIREARMLYEKGASYVFMPHYLGAQFASHLIVHHQLDQHQYEKEKEKHLRYFEKRIAV